ncbi:MAG: PASTA domain-containing protein [Bacteroidetes bacterium]|nr:PASTA domain-containing protein [Bacteroidota bacterium]MBS1974796.1 PASTA domain-containing protein [Bacteroidota bacterium]
MTGKPLWVNMLAAIILLLLLLLIFLGSLSLITKHGKTLKIPSVTGKSYKEAKMALEGQGFDVQVQDSIYVDTIPPMQVIRQFPEGDNVVKVNRTVYLTINRSVAPFVQMPNLIGMSFRNAVLILRQYGLEVGDTVFKPDFAKNSILGQMYNGENIKPGTQVQQGRKITLVLGNGIGAYEFPVPDFVGLKYSEASALLTTNQLIPGATVIDTDVTDTANAYVYRQNPSRFDFEDKKYNTIRQGQTVDFWLGVKQPVKQTDSMAITPQAQTPPKQ